MMVGEGYIFHSLSLYYLEFFALKLLPSFITYLPLLHFLMSIKGYQMQEIIQDKVWVVCWTKMGLFIWTNLTNPRIQ